MESYKKGLDEALLAAVEERPGLCQPASRLPPGLLLPSYCPRDHCSLYLTTLLVCFDAPSAPQPEIVEEGDLPEIRGDNFWANIKKHNGMVVVLAYTSHCIPCKTVKPEMAKWAKELEGQVAFYKFALTLPNKERALEVSLDLLTPVH